LIIIGRYLCWGLHEVWNTRVCSACTWALITWKRLYLHAMANAQYIWTDEEGTN
jgi:hypothetical protein